MSETNTFDLMVAGAGAAGILCSARLSFNHPGARVLLLDKEPLAGGRISVNPSGKQQVPAYTSGLSLVSSQLFEYMALSLASSDPDHPGILPESFPPVPLVSVLASGKLATFPWEKWLKPECLKIFGGSAALEEWSGFESLLEKAPLSREQSFSRQWKSGKKSAMATVLKNFAPVIGIPDPLSMSTSALREKLLYLSMTFHQGPWNSIWEHSFSLSDRITLKSACRIVRGAKSDGLWELETEAGNFKSSCLIVAQPPWEALNWLAGDVLPGPVLQLAMKSRPVSVVVLSLRGDLPEDLPSGIILIPAEECYAIANGSDTLCLHAVIDFEQSLDAPMVVKSIKKLRRAGKKLEKALPGLQIKKEHLALLPAGWCQSGAVGEKKFLERLTPEGIQSPSLCFAGDAYGTTWNPDENLIKSVSSACDVVGAGLKLLTHQGNKHEPDH